MASVVQICNMALSHIGSDARVSSISPPDGSVEAGYCATFYDQARTELLEPGTWAFALARASLAQVANLSDLWLYAYTLPSDCLRARRILRLGADITVFTQDEYQYQTDDNDSSTFEIEGSVLYTNAPNAVLVYTRDLIDTTRFTPSFTTAFSYLLSSYLAGPILKGSEGTKTGDAMRQRAMTLADVSAASSANASVADHQFTAAQLRARR